MQQCSLKKKKYLWLRPIISGFEDVLKMLHKLAQNITNNMYKCRLLSWIEGESQSTECITSTENQTTQFVFLTTVR